VTPVRVAHLADDLARSLQRLRADRSRSEASRAVVDRALRDGAAYYGINTGFGILARQRLPDDQLEVLQRNLILSHAAGVGDPVPRGIARLMLHLKLHSLGLGHSGVSAPTLDRLLLLAERDLVPLVPSRGSVGASGDLAPLAHLCLPLLGLGRFLEEDGSSRPAGEVLAEHGLEPVTLQPKEGLALINGTQLMGAYGGFVLERALRLLRTADVIAAVSLEALQGSAVPFDARIHAVRPHPGQGRVAANVRRLLDGSGILDPTTDDLSEALPAVADQRRGEA